MAPYSISKKTRNSLIQATGELVAEKGFPSVSTREITKLAGENLSSIRYHFGSKEKLFEEVIRVVTKDHRENPISDILNSYRDKLDSSKIQTKVLKAIVKRFISAFLSHDNPWWYSNIAYQVLQSKNPLKKLIKKEVIDPYFTTLQVFVKHIKPNLNKEEVLLYTRIILGSLVIHTHNIEQGLIRDEQKYSLEYLKLLEEMTIKQNLFLLGLK